MNLALRVQNDILNERLKELHLKLEKKQSEVISKLIQTDPIPTDAVPLPPRDSDKLVTCRLVDYPDSDTMSDQGSNFPLLHENPSDITADVVAEDLISTALTRADVQLSEAGAVESPEAALADNLMCSGADSQVPMEAIGTSDSWGETAESNPSTSGTTAPRIQRQLKWWVRMCPWLICSVPLKRALCSFRAIPSLRSL